MYVSQHPGSSYFMPYTMWDQGGYSIWLEGFLILSYRPCAYGIHTEALALFVDQFPVLVRVCVSLCF